MLRALQNQRRKSADAGFTLIELLIVIIILGVLAAIVVFSVSGITNKASKNACQAEVATVDTAIEAFYANGDPTGVYPTTVAQLIPGFLHSTPKYVDSVTSGTSGHGAGVVAGAPCPGDS